MASTNARASIPTWPVLSLLVAVALATAAPGKSAGTSGDRPLEALARAAAEADGANAKRAIEALREAGPDGLAALMAAHRKPINAALDSARRDGSRPSLPPRLRRALDRVAAQKDAWASGLYWYRDLDRARAAAERLDRPILSLRMLGRLDRDRSCANSRFFRTALYPDPKVNELLREKFVLHWHSVRDVPKITIEMGDGRRIERTITGNSAHYVLDAEGRPVDVLPGLYAAATFHRLLRRAHAIAQYLEKHKAAKRVEQLRAYHRRWERELRVQWTRALDRIGAADGDAEAPEGQAVGADPRRGDAAAAGDRAPTKRAVQRPMLRALDLATLRERTGEPEWRRLGEAFAERATLGLPSRAVMRMKIAGRDGRAAEDPSPSRRHTAFAEIVARFERSIAEDTARNEYRLHREVHEGFRSGNLARLSPEELDEHVYAELFLMPLDDPWLGLAPARTYSGLDGRGLEPAR